MPIKLLLSDFGISVKLKNNQKQISGQSGTYRYMAPEIFKREGEVFGRQYDPFKADVYSLGVMLVHMISKQFPLEQPAGKDPKASSPTLVKDFFASKRNIYKINASEDLIDLVQRMLAFEPNKRITLPDIYNHPWFTRHVSLLTTDSNAQKSVHSHLSRRLEYTTTLTRVSINKKDIGYEEPPQDQMDADPANDLPPITPSEVLP